MSRRAMSARTACWSSSSPRVRRSIPSNSERDATVIGTTTFSSHCSGVVAARASSPTRVSWTPRVAVSTFRLSFVSFASSTKKSTIARPSPERLYSPSRARPPRLTSVTRRCSRSRWSPWVARFRGFSASGNWSCTRVRRSSTSRSRSAAVSASRTRRTSRQQRSAVESAIDTCCVRRRAKSRSMSMGRETYHVRGGGCGTTPCAPRPGRASSLCPSLCPNPGPRSRLDPARYEHLRHPDDARTLHVQRDFFL